MHTRVSDEADAWEGRARMIYEELMVALQIVLYTGEFKPGRYRRPDPYDTRTWVPA